MSIVVDIRALVMRSPQRLVYVNRSSYHASNSNLAD